MAFSLGGMGRLPSSPAVDPLELMVHSGSCGHCPLPRKPSLGSPEPGRCQDALLLSLRGHRPSPSEPKSESPIPRVREAPDQVGMSPGTAPGPAVPRLRSGRGAGAGPAGEVQEAREPMGTLRGAGLAATACGRALSGWRASAGHLRSAPRASRRGAPVGRTRGTAAPSRAAAAPLPCCRPTCWTWTRTRTTWRCSVR